jgi:hypothetical protein
LSRHRKIRLSRSKAIVIAAAGALSVATAASATAATWSQGAQGHAASSDGPTEITHAAAGVPRLAVADQLTRPIAEAENQQDNATLAEHTFQLRLTQARDAIAQRQAARKRAAELAARNTAATARTAAARAQAAGQPRQPGQPGGHPGQTAAASVAAASGSPRQVAQAMLGSFGWSSSQFSCLDPLWEHESGWGVTAAKPRVGRLRHPAGAARLPDGQRRAGLADQRGHPDQVGPAVHQGHLRLALRRLVARAGHRLVLSLILAG